MARGFAGCCGEAKVAGAVPGTHFYLLSLNDTLCKKSTSVNLIRWPEQAPRMVCVCGGRHRHRGLSSVAGGVGSGSGQWVSRRERQWGSFQVSWSQGRMKHPPSPSGESVVCGIVPWTGSSAGKRRFSETPARAPGLAPGGHLALPPGLPWARLPNAPLFPETGAELCASVASICHPSAPAPHSSLPNSQLECRLPEIGDTRAPHRRTGGRCSVIAGEWNTVPWCL